MKITISDYKKRKTLPRELKSSLRTASREVFGATVPSEIKEIRITVLKRFPTAEGYNRAFARLYQKGVVNLILTPGYDRNPIQRLSLITHELVHVKQFITKELKFIYNPVNKTKYYIFKNKKYTKVYSLAKFDSFTDRTAQINYISTICPWERAPSLLADKLAPLAFK